MLRSGPDRPWIHRPRQSTRHPESIGDAFARGGSAIFATVCGRPAGVIMVSEAVPGVARWSRVSVHPDFQRHGVASTMVASAEDYAAELGFRRAELFAREELADLIAFWHHRGFGLARTVPHGVILTKTLPVAVGVPTAEAMQRLGARLATVLQRGDLDRRLRRAWRGQNDAGPRSWAGSGQRRTHSFADLRAFPGTSITDG